MPGITKYKHDEYVECRYYRKESTIDIKCKGLCGTHTVNTFSDGEAKKEYKYDFCNGNYWNCPLFIALSIDDEELET